MKYNYLDSISPDMYWAEIQSLLRYNRNEFETHRLLGLTYMYQEWVLESYAELVDRSELAEPFGLVWCERLRYALHLRDVRVDYVWAKMDSAAIVDLARLTLVQWPLLEANVLVFASEFTGCVDTHAGERTHSNLRCCSYHERQRGLVLEQLGREYLLCRQVGLCAPDLSHSHWESTVRAHKIGGKPLAEYL